MTVEEQKEPQQPDSQPVARGAEVAKPYTGFAGKLDKFFGIRKNNSSISVEIFAGIATFLAMMYILVVNPTQIVGEPGKTNVMWSSVFLATAFGAVIGTLLMALFAKMPLAQAPGMGINAMLGAVIGGYSAYGLKLNFGSSMLLVLISGLVFLALTVIPCGRNKETGKLIGIREKIFTAIPESIRFAIPVGVGLFITFIGFQNAGLIVTNGYTQVSLVSFTDWGKQLVQWGGNAAVGDTGLYAWFGAKSFAAAKTAIVAIVSLIAIALLAHYKVKGSVILGIVIGTLFAMCMQVVNYNVIQGTEPGITWEFWKNFENFFSMDTAKGGSFLASFRDISFEGTNVMSIVVIIITFSMLDMFDTMGTALGCCQKANLLDEEGKPIRFNEIMISDAVATCTGAMLGTSTVTTFIESGAGIAAGGKTGLTALTTAALFLLSIFFVPIFAFVPSCAAAGALIYVGVLMMSEVKRIDFSDLRNAVPAFFTIVIMPLGYSITGGIGIGMISYVIINVICYAIDSIKYAANKESAKKPEWKISVVLAIVTAVFLLYFFLPAGK